MTDAAPWDAWLTGSECLPALEGVARSIVRLAGRIGLPDGLLPCEPLEHLSGGDLEDCVQAIAHDLWIHLRSRPDSWWNGTAARWLSHQGERALILRIGRDYLRHLKDQSRTHGLSPWRALYRRVRQVLQEEASIPYRATSRGSFYSLDPDAPELTDPTVLRAVPYEGWSSPLHLAPAAELHHRDRLIALARFFWEEAARHLGGKGCFLPVRELVHYLSRHYDCSGPIAASFGREGPRDSVEDLATAMEAPGADLAPELAVVGGKIQRLAEQLVATWAEKERRVFYWLHGEGLTLESVAERMGYKGASGVSYIHRSALDRLRDFCLLWPGLSPPDLDEELFDAFVECVLDVCKGKI